MNNKYRKRRSYKKVKSIKFIVIILCLIFIIFHLNKLFAVNINKNQFNNIEIINKEQDNIIEENVIDVIIEDDNNNKENVIDVIIEDDNNNKENVYNIDNKNNEYISKKNVEFNEKVAFIGNSRTQAFLMYTGLKDVIDYTNIGLMVDTAITKKFVTDNKGNKITLLEDLKYRDIDKIYIMLGINELGWVYSSIFIEKYEELIDKIKEIKPNCEIFIQSIIPVTKTKSDNDKIYNNKKINEYNKLIKELAERKNLKYIDLVPVLSDKYGNLPEEASTDGIHLNKEYSLKWLKKLEEN